MMRTIAVTMCLFLSAPAWGQLPPEGAKRAEYLDTILLHWETVMSRVTSLEASCERMTEDRIFKKNEVYKGTVKYLKGNGPGVTSRASLHLVNAANPADYDLLVFSNPFLYLVSPSTKEIHVHELPPPKGGENAGHNLIGLLFGMKAAQAKERYKIDLVDVDANYYILSIEPKLANDKADFHKAYLALVKTTYLPRRLQLIQANGNKVIWDLPRIQTPAANLVAADFMQPNLPGFKTNRVQPTRMK